MQTAEDVQGGLSSEASCAVSGLGLLLRGYRAI